MKLIPITEICDFQGGSQPPKNQWSLEKLPGYVRMLQIRDFTQSERTKPEYVKETKSLKKCSADDVLIGRYGASVGKILTGHAGAYNVAIVKTIPDETKLNKKFLYYILKSPEFQKFILNVGGRAAQAGFNKSDLRKFKVPLIAINDQIRTAHLLSKVEGLIAQRRQQCQQLDELLGSVFLEMFGDPVENEKQWNKKALKDLLSQIDSGWSPKCEAVPATNEQYGVLKLGAVTSGVFKQEENKAMLPNIEPKTQHEVKAGDLLFTRKNTYELVAATAFVHETRSKLLLPDLIFRLVIKDKNEIHPIYLWKLLSSPSQRKKIQSLAGGAAGSMPNISKANLKSILLPVPDIGLQVKFVEIVNKVEVIKNEFQNGLNELELLYGSLSQSAFKGELDLNAIQLPKEPDREVDSQHVEYEQVLESQLQKKIERATRSFEPINKSLEKIKKITQPIEQITKPLDIVTKYVNSFNLPKVTPDFSNDRIRKKWLVKLLEEKLVELDTHSLLSLPDFWKYAKNWISDFTSEDGDSFSFSIDDYEVLKDFVFNEVRNGSLFQEYEEASNSIKFKVNNK